MSVVFDKLMNLMQVERYNQIFIEHVVVYLQLFIRGSLRVVILIRPVI